jgi:hypothetical protein
MIGKYSLVVLASPGKRAESLHRQGNHNDALRTRMEADADKTKLERAGEQESRRRYRVQSCHQHTSNIPLRRGADRRSIAAAIGGVSLRVILG